MNEATIHKVNYRTEQRGTSVTYDLLQVENACENFDFATKEILNFGEFDYRPTPVFAVAKEHGPYGETWTEERAIMFCPFCGAKLEYVEKEKRNFVSKTVERKVTESVWELQPSNSGSSSSIHIRGSYTNFTKI